MLRSLSSRLRCWHRPRRHGETGEAFEDAEQFLVPGPAQDLLVARPARRAEWPEPRKVVATLRGWRNGEAAPNEVPGSAGLPGSWLNPMRTRLPSRLTVLSNNAR